jgi:hypothetical protein
VGTGPEAYEREVAHNGRVAAVPVFEKKKTAEKKFLSQCKSKAKKMKVKVKMKE